MSRERATRDPVRRSARAMLACVALAACAAPRDDLASARFFAAHNALRASGLAAVGPVQRGSLAEGREVELPAELGAGCFTFVAVGGGGVEDLALTLLDESGAKVGEDDARDPEAALRACIDKPGRHRLALRMAAGHGEWLVSTWSGGERAAEARGAVVELGAAGTCDSPAPILLGTTYQGTTEAGLDEHDPGCGPHGGREVVHRLDLDRRQRVTIQVDAQFDGVLYVRRGDCLDEDADEVACNDDAPGSPRRSRIDAVLDPGTWFVFVDGYGEEAGSYRLRATGAAVPSVAEVCGGARALVAGARATGSLEGPGGVARASCGQDARGPDAPWTLDLAARARVRVRESSSDFDPVLHLRRVCADATSEIGCAEEGSGRDDATWTGLLDPGSYAVLADSEDEAASGAYELDAETAPEQGGGAPGDVCASAIADGAGGGLFSTDTFEAKDDLATSCGGAGAADVVRRLDVRKRAMVTAWIESSEAPHVLAIQRACGDESTEVACGARIERELAPGTYWLVVEGAAPDAFGRALVQVREVDAKVASPVRPAAPARRPRPRPGPPPHRAPAVR